MSRSTPRQFHTEFRSHDSAQIFLPPQKFSPSPIETKQAPSQLRQSRYPIAAPKTDRLTAPQLTLPPQLRASETANSKSPISSSNDKATPHPRSPAAAAQNQS